MAMAGASAQKRAARAARLVAIAEDLRLDPSQSQETLAAKHDVSQRQISSDVATLLQQWQDSALSRTHERIGIQDAQYNALIKAHMPLALEGKTRNAEIVISALEKQSKLLGLDQPAKQQIEMDGGLRVEIVGMADEELP